MYTKQEASRQRQAFWTAFGQYMQPILSAEGEKINWINYKTGVSGIHFRMDADNMEATIAISLSHHDRNLQEAHYQQFLALKAMLTEALQDHWEWQALYQDDYGKTISRVSKTISDVNINRNEDWPAIISFFKPRIMALDAFWSMARYVFEL